MCGPAGALDSLVLIQGAPEMPLEAGEFDGKPGQDAARERQGRYGDRYSTASNNSSCGGPR
ncbi:hypothetical protein GCM10027398_01490 [Azotobacter salinestris]